jgi:hypothetical protein
LCGLFQCTHALRTLAFKHIDEENGRFARPCNSIEPKRSPSGRDSFNDCASDQDLWNTLVTPRIECNLYRKRFLPLQKIEKLLPALSSWTEPWLVWQGHRLLYGWSCLRTATTFFVATSTKRSPLVVLSQFVNHNFVVRSTVTACEGSRRSRWEDLNRIQRLFPIWWSVSSYCSKPSFFRVIM